MVNKKSSRICRTRLKGVFCLHMKNMGICLKMTYTLYIRHVFRFSYQRKVALSYVALELAFTWATFQHMLCSASYVVVVVQVRRWDNHLYLQVNSLLLFTSHQYYSINLRLPEHNFLANSSGEFFSSDKSHSN